MEPQPQTQNFDIDTEEQCSAVTNPEEYLADRAARGSRAAFEAALARVPVAPPDPHDAL